MRKYKILSSLLFTFVMVLSACINQDTPLPPDSAIGVANPASTHCEQKSGKLEIRSDATGGQYGVCIFDDGSECEEWAFFRGECKPGENMVAPSPQPLPSYINEQYGFSLNPTSDWAIEGYEDHLILHRRTLKGEEYILFIGFRRVGEGGEPFRTSMPAGEFVDSDTIQFADRLIAKRLLVLEGKTKVVEYGVNLEAGELRLFIWLDILGEEDNAAADIPPEIIAEADQILSSFKLLR